MVTLNKTCHHEFKNTKVFDPQFLHHTCMDEEFFEVFGAIGWG